MGIHLLTVSGLSLEVRGKGLPVHEPVASNNTNRGALGEYVQKRGLLLKCIQSHLTWLRDKGGRTFPAPDSPINAVNFPGTT